MLVALVSSVTMISAPSKLIALDNPISEKAEYSLFLDSANIIKSNKTLPEIKPGESLIQRAEREAREKAEAEAKAKAEAEALAKAQSEAKNTQVASRNTVSRGTRVYTDPSDFDELYARAGQAFGVDPRLLRAVHTVETGASGSTSRSSFAGAIGPMQFLPSTFRHYAVDGNGDGIKDITNVEDAIYTAAAYLKACGYPDVKKALWGYNPSTSYYNKVTRIAVSFGMPL